MQGRLGRCDIDKYYGVSIQQCTAQNNNWTKAHWNYDNIFEAMITLFVLSSMEAWPNLVGDSWDAGSVDGSGPVYLGNPWILCFYFPFIFICTIHLTLGVMFLMDLFVGVIFYQYGREIGKQNSLTVSICTEEQVKWVMLQRLVRTSKPSFNIMEAPRKGWRIHPFQTMTHPKFDPFIYSVIILNTIEMALYMDDISDTYRLVLSIVNIACTCVFIWEATIRICAIGRKHFKRAWNWVKISVLAISNLP